jgi:hypothetical protein
VMWLLFAVGGGGLRWAPPAACSPAVASDGRPPQRALQRRPPMGAPRSVLSDGGDPRRQAPRRALHLSCSILLLVLLSGDPRVALLLVGMSARGERRAPDFCGQEVSGDKDKVG